jgi:hypothetical protein
MGPFYTIAVLYLVLLWSKVSCPNTDTMIEFRGPLLLADMAEFETQAR